MELRRNKPGTYLVTGCVHVPFELKEMYSSIFKMIKKEGIILSGVVLAGDILDLNSLSSHDKGKVPIAGVTLGSEYAAGRRFISQIESLPFAKGATFDYIFGNHEDRWFREMRDIDQSKKEGAFLTIEEGLRLGKHWNVLSNWKDDSVWLGNYLNIVHGFFTNVHAAKKHLDSYRHSVMFFHTHRFQTYVEGMHGAFNGGWGGDVTSPAFGYASRSMKASWYNNAYLVHIDKDGWYTTQPLNYVNGHLIVNGRAY